MIAASSEVSHYSTKVGHSGQDISIQIEGLKSTDSYATNLELTGCTNWFGSSNMCDLLAANAKELFGSESIDSDCNIRCESSECRVLELGSGLGRAGMMAAKIMEAEGNGGTIVLTDGEEDVVSMLLQNCIANGLKADVLAGDGADPCSCSCQQLLWGDAASLEGLSDRYPSGFDIIIGADLIYGPAAKQHLKALMYTVDYLLGRKELATGSFSDRCDSNLVEPVFYLAFTRRGPITIEELCEAALKHNLQHNVLNDYTFDLFNNNVDTESMFWGDTIIAFTRG